MRLVPANLARALGVLSLSLVPSLTACGSKKPDPVDAPPPTSAPAEDATPAADAAPAPVPDAAPAPDTAAAPADEAAAVKPEGPEIPVTTKSPEALKVFNEARDLMLNHRDAAATELFEKAVELDPDFLQGQIYLGWMDTGPASLEAMEKTLAAAKDLPEAERVHLEAIVAYRKGDDAKAAALEKKTVELAPGDYRGYLYVAWRSSYEGKYDEVLSYMNRAVLLKPDFGALHNMLGYAYLGQKRFPEAIAAFVRYSELAPTEPNAFDSLGDAYLAAFELDKAEAAFAKAVELDKTFVAGGIGLAVTRAHRGNLAGAREAIVAAATNGARNTDKTHAVVRSAWVDLLDGKNAEMYATLSDVFKAGEDEWAPFAAFDLAFIESEVGHQPEADAAIVSGWKRAQETLNGDLLLQAEKQYQPLAIRAALRNGKPDEAKTLLDAHEAKHGESVYLRGMLLLASDPKAAAAELGKCPLTHANCTLYRIRALEKAGDAAAAAEVRAQVDKLAPRSFEYVWMKQRLAAK